MRVIVEVSTTTAEKIEGLVAQGKFNSLPEFIQVAVHNQLLLEELDEEGLLKLGLGDVIHQSPSSEATQLVLERPLGPDLLKLNPHGYGDIEISASSQESSLDPGPLWGQYNRLFPVKVVVRVLANLMLYSRGPIGLQDFTEEAAEIARRLGHRLRDLDKAQRRAAGQKLATALPVGSDPYKSKKRFINQFIGYLDTQGRMIGATPTLGFVSILDPKSPRIGLTKQGLLLAEKANPILDSASTKGPSLSSEEIHFYLRHLQQYLPAEAELAALIVERIDQGENRPEGLKKVVSTCYPAWSSGQVSTVEGGLVARLIELGLVLVARSGRMVRYYLAESGRAWLASRGGRKNVNA